MRGSAFHIIGLVSNGETYLLTFWSWQIAEALRQLGRWASDPRLAFNWYDAAVMSHRIRKLEAEWKAPWE